MSELYGRGYQRLREQQSLEEVLKIAVEFERTARDFYTSLVPKVSKQIRDLVQELADEEQLHFDMFGDLMAQQDVMEQIQQKIDVPASNGAFSDCIHLPDLGDNPDDQSVLQYALGREHAAMEQYRSLAESAPEGPLKSVFQFLANEETHHKNQLEEIYYKIVHSGGV
jgi:rubrerythrin